MYNEMSDKDLYKFLREKAILNDPYLQQRIGCCYLWGTCGINKNLEEAFKWFELSSEQGNAAGQRSLGFFYEKGFDNVVKVDLNKAKELYELAASQGDAFAQFDLGRLYSKGECVKKNYKTALDFFKLSSIQNFWDASAHIGDIYFEGKYIERNLSEAKKYYEKALSDISSNAGTFRYPIENQTLHIQQRINDIIKLEASSNSNRTEIFICYSHKDDQYMKEIADFLKFLNNTNNINYWNDTKIKSGEQWEQEITKALSRAKVAILITSINFFISDYIQKNELPRILEAADMGGTTIIWIPAKTYPREDTLLEKYETILDPKTPLIDLKENDRNRVYTKLYNRIKELCDVL